jgi:spore germination protein GerM
MTRGRVLFLVVLLVAVGSAWALVGGGPRWYHRTATPASLAPVATPRPDPLGRKIKARLFYVAEDGTHLDSLERDVPYADTPTDQAREILNAQIAPVAEPLISAIPAGTALRAVFVTPQGEAFVDLSRDVSTAHPGGTMNELLTIYTVVHALTFNMPAITAVQLLVDGKEVDTLAGHVDLRRPLAKNLQFTVEP